MVILALILLAAPVFSGPPDYAAELISRARELRLAQDPGWLAVGHYKPTRRGRFESRVVAGTFFLSPGGRNDPEGELSATLKAFAGGTQGSQCLFPARYRWLEARLGFDPSRLPVEDCPKLSAWREGIDASGATVVFADAFLGNPSSMFGHTFLRLRRKTAAGDDDLLDYTINYAGLPRNGEGLLDGIRGLTGGLPGLFSVEPYYLKVQEYTNMESRDLWEYDLNLDSAAVDRLVDHAWELTHARFDYYFFTENCSYQLLTLIDAARPELRLEDGFGFAVVPGDTVRAYLARPGLVGGVRYRPSHVTQMKARRARLAADEFSLATRLGRSAGPAEFRGLEAFSPERRALILDSADDLLRYREGFFVELSTAAANSERALLVSRGRLGLPPLPAEIPRPRRLEEGHDSARLGAAAGVTRLSSYEEVSWRGALHDLASPDIGYLPDSQLQALNLRLRFDNKDRVPYVERFDLVDIMSLSPWEAWNRKPSWKASAGIDQAKELGCGPVACMHYDLDAGLGLAFETHLGRKEIYYALAETDFGAAPVFNDGWRIGAGGTAGIAVEEAETLKTTAEATYIGYLNSPSRERLRLAQAWRLSRDVELRLNLDKRVPDQEAGLTFFYYY
ncbi:MAG: DUF4105 domain-containing protein [Elusimicrobia bacterium]|nr:DUF4105 domain-containing protein [Elusimicrobiota bacterium]